MKELLSPVGNKEMLYQAIHNGADAVYLAGKLYNARSFANNFDYDELKNAVEYAHLYGVRVYVAVNTIIYENEVKDFLEYIKYLYLIGVDALIMQDIGMITLVKKHFKDFEIHASTQTHNYNKETIIFLKNLGVSRVVLARELSLKEIEEIDVDIEKEVFIHGALCVAYSGCCLFSSISNNRSANRGECIGNCRMLYNLIEDDKTIIKNKYLLSMRELNNTSNIDKLMNSSISSFKIEGRMKSPTYVGYITRIYRKLIDNYLSGKSLNLTLEEIDNLKILYNRKFTNGFLFNDDVINIDTSNHQGLEIGRVIEVTRDKIKIRLDKDLYQEDGIRFNKSSLGMIVNKLYNEKHLLISHAKCNDIVYVDNKIGLKDIDTISKTTSKHLEEELKNVKEKKIKINVSISAHLEKDFILTFSDDKNIVEIKKDIIKKAITRPITKEEIIRQINKLKDTPFEIDDIKIDIDDDIFINLKDLNEIRRSAVSLLINKRTLVKRCVKSFKLEEVKNNKIDDDLNISALARSKEQIKALIFNDVSRIYVTDYDLYNEYKHLDNVYYRVERTEKNYKDAPRLLVTSLGAINHYKDKEMISDYYLNVSNNYSIKLLKDMNIKKITLSVEVKDDELKNINTNDLEIIIYGRVELMVMKYCMFKDLLNNCKICKKNNHKYFLENSFNEKYPLVKNACFNHILNSKVLDNFSKIPYYKSLNIKNYRLELFDEDYSMTEKLIKKIKDKFYEV